MLSRTYENWKIADAATQRLFVDLRSLEECKEQLRRAKKRRAQEQQKRYASVPRPVFLTRAPCYPGYYCT